MILRFLRRAEEILWLVYLDATQGPSVSIVAALSDTFRLLRPHGPKVKTDNSSTRKKRTRYEVLARARGRTERKKDSRHSCAALNDRGKWAPCESPANETPLSSKPTKCSDREEVEKREKKDDHRSNGLSLAEKSDRIGVYTFSTQRNSDSWG